MIVSGQPSNNLIDDHTRGFEVFLHEKDQFWQGSDMENIGQTKPIDFEINNEVRGTFLLVQSRKINTKEEPCEERRDHSFTKCISNFADRRAGCELNWVESNYPRVYPPFPPCKSWSDILLYIDILSNLSLYSWTELTRTTGCLGKCRYNKYIFSRVRVSLTPST